MSLARNTTHSQIGGNEVKAKRNYPVVARNHVRVLSRREAGSDTLLNSLSSGRSDPERNDVLELIGC